MLAYVSQGGRVGPATTILNIWFVWWAIRFKGELDYMLDLTARVIRWLVIAICLGFVCGLPELVYPPTLRVCVAFIGVAFLVWPNLAYHATRVVRLIKLIRTPDPSN